MTFTSEYFVLNNWLCGKWIFDIKKLIQCNKDKIFKKMKKKKDLEISSFYIDAPKIMIRWYMVPEIWSTTDGWIDGGTDRWKKGHIKRHNFFTYTFCKAFSYTLSFIIYCVLKFQEHLHFKVLFNGCFC